jgi:hypothetical protein
MNKSEVFEEYIKIMNNGLNKTAQRANLEPRKKEIQYLYRNEEDVVKYNKNLMQEAHPKKVIFGPAYDPINALVENNIERHDIMMAIVNKTPTGQLDHKKYAEQQLQLSLIKIANELDFQDNQLRPLADTCIDQFVKQAAWNYAVLALAGVIGLLYAQQHLPAAQQPLEMSYNELKESIDDILTANSNWLVGEDYTEQFRDMVEDLKKKADATFKECSKITNIVAKFDKPKDAEEAIRFAQSEEAKKIAPTIDFFEKFHEKVIPYFDQAARRFKDQQFQLRQIKDKGFFTDLADKSHILHGGKGLFINKLDKLSQTVEAFNNSVKGYAKSIKEAIDQKEVAHQDLQQASQSPSGLELPSMPELPSLSSIKDRVVDAVTPGTAPSTNPTNKPKAPRQLSDEEKRILELLNNNE